MFDPLEFTAEAVEVSMHERPASAVVSLSRGSSPVASDRGSIAADGAYDGDGIDERVADEEGDKGRVRPTSVGQHSLTRWEFRESEHEKRPSSGCTGSVCGTSAQRELKIVPGPTHLFEEPARSKRLRT